MIKQEPKELSPEESAKYIAETIKTMRAGLNVNVGMVIDNELTKCGSMQNCLGTVAFVLAAQMVPWKPQIAHLVLNAFVTLIKEEIAEARMREIRIREKRETQQ
jgi:hypothetical protein